MYYQLKQVKIQQKWGHTKTPMTFLDPGSSTLMFGFPVFNFSHLSFNCLKVSHLNYIRPGGHTERQTERDRHTDRRNERQIVII